MAKYEFHGNLMTQVLFSRKMWKTKGKQKWRGNIMGGEAKAMRRRARGDKGPRGKGESKSKPTNPNIRRPPSPLDHILASPTTQTRIAPPLPISATSSIPQANNLLWTFCLQSEEEGRLDWSDYSSISTAVSRKRRGQSSPAFPQFLEKSSLSA